MDLDLGMDININTDIGIDPLEKAPAVSGAVSTGKEPGIWYRDMSGC